MEKDLNLPLEYLKVLIWPCILVYFTIYFRKPVEELLARLTKAELPGDISLVFEANLREGITLSKEVERLLQPEPAGVQAVPANEINARLASVGLQPSPSGFKMDYYRNMARQNPNFAIAGLRMEMDLMTRNLVKGFRLDFTQADSVYKLLEILFNNRKISESQMNLTKKILELCSAATQGKNITYDEAIQIIDIADVLRKDYVRWLSWGFGGEWRPQEQD